MMTVQITLEMRNEGYELSPHVPAIKDSEGTLYVSKADMKLVREKIRTYDEHAALHKKYSGRYMFGAECLGFSSVSSIYIIAGFLAVARERNWGICPDDLAGWAQTDSLGLGVIVYFPNIKVLEK